MEGPTYFIMQQFMNKPPLHISGDPLTDHRLRDLWIDKLHFTSMIQLQIRKYFIE